MPEDTPIINQIEAHLAGAHVFLVNVLINDCGRLVREGAAALGWFVGQVMKKTGGRANPRRVNELLRKALGT